MTASHTESRQRTSVQLEESFLEAYDAYAEALFRKCYFSVRDRELAHDIVQETFTRTWNYLCEGRRIDYFRAFLYRTANNLIVDTIRRKRSVSLDALIEDVGIEVRDEHATNPENQASAQEVLNRLHILDDMYERVIRLRYLEGKTPRDIALQLGVSENVVFVRLHRGLRRLALLMGRQGRYSTASTCGSTGA